MPKFLAETCEVCHETIADISRLPAEIQEQVYKPDKDESYYTEVDFSEERRGFDAEPTHIDVDLNE